MLAAGRAKGGENVRFCDKLVRLRAEKGFSQECRFVKHVGRYSNEGKGWESNTVKGA